MILLDTSGLLAALFPDQTKHDPCRAVLERSRRPFVLSPFILAELDYLILKFAGEAAESTFLEDVAAEAYQLAPFNTTGDQRVSGGLVKRFRCSPGVPPEETSTGVVFVSR